MGQSNWLVAGIVPGVDRQPSKRLTTGQYALLQLLHRWRKEATQAGCTIKRIAVAYEAGRDGFWLARWLRAHEIEAYVIHPSSVPVSREHRRAKTDRLDTELYQPAETSAGRFCNGCLGGGVGSMSQGLRVLVLLKRACGCAANRSTAAWLRSPQSRTRYKTSE